MGCAVHLGELHNLPGSPECDEDERPEDEGPQPEVDADAEEQSLGLEELGPEDPLQVVGDELLQTIGLVIVRFETHLVQLNADFIHVTSKMFRQKNLSTSCYW